MDDQAGSNSTSSQTQTNNTQNGLISQGITESFANIQANQAEFARIERELRTLSSTIPSEPSTSSRSRRSRPWFMVEPVVRDGSSQPRPAHQHHVHFADRDDYFLGENIASSRPPPPALSFRSNSPSPYARIPSSSVSAQPLSTSRPESFSEFIQMMPRLTTNATSTQAAPDVLPRREMPSLFGNSEAENSSGRSPASFSTFAEMARFRALPDAERGILGTPPPTSSTAPRRHNLRHGHEPLLSITPSASIMNWRTTRPPTLEPPPTPQRPPTAEQAAADRLQVAAKVASTKADTSHNCAICLDEISLKVIIRPCFHQFCHLCLFEWFKAKTVCPVCRQEIGKILYNIVSETVYEECALPMSGFGGRASLLDEAFYMVNGGGDPGISISISLRGGGGRSDFNSLLEHHRHAILHRAQRLYIEGAAGDRPRLPCPRLTRVTLIQLLATLHEKYPMGEIEESGVIICPGTTKRVFPTQELSLEGWSAVATSNWSPAATAPPASALPSLYRAFLYLHNYAPLVDGKARRSWACRRASSVTFLQSNPVARRRLVAFVSQELEALGRAYSLVIRYPGGKDMLLERVEGMLSLYDLSSPTFAASFRELLSSGCNVAGYVDVNGGGPASYDILTKMYQELVLFASAVPTEMEDYLKVVTFVAPASIDVAPVVLPALEEIEVVAGSETSSSAGTSFASSSSFSSTLSSSSNSSASSSVPSLVSTSSASTSANSPEIIELPSPPALITLSSSPSVSSPASSSPSTNQLQPPSPTPSVISNTTTVALGENTDTLSVASTVGSTGGRRGSGESGSSHPYVYLRNHLSRTNSSAISRAFLEAVAVRMAAQEGRSGSGTSSALPTVSEQSGRSLVNISRTFSANAHRDPRPSVNPSDGQRTLSSFQRPPNNTSGQSNLPQSSPAQISVITLRDDGEEVSVGSQGGAPSTLVAPVRQPERPMISFRGPRRPEIELITLSTDTEDEDKKVKPLSKKAKVSKSSKDDSSLSSEIEWIPPVGVPVNNNVTAGPSSQPSTSNSSYSSPSTSSSSLNVSNQHRSSVIVDQSSMTMSTGPSAPGSKRIRSLAALSEGQGEFQQRPPLAHTSNKRPCIKSFSSGSSRDLQNVNKRESSLTPSPPANRLLTSYYREIPVTVRSSSGGAGRRRQKLLSFRKSEIMSMRRTIRASTTSAYHHRKLIAEVRRKYSGNGGENGVNGPRKKKKKVSTSILNDAAFRHLEPVFEDLYFSSKVLPPASTLAEHVSARRSGRDFLPPGVLRPCTSATAAAEGFEALERLVDRRMPTTTLKKEEKDSHRPQTTLEVLRPRTHLHGALYPSTLSGSKTDNSADQMSSTESEEECRDPGPTQFAAYEAANRPAIAQAAIQHVITPSRRAATVALVKRIQTGIPFVNHLYSEED